MAVTIRIASSLCLALGLSAAARAEQPGTAPGYYYYPPIPFYGGYPPYWSPPGYPAAAPPVTQAMPRAAPAPTPPTTLAPAGVRVGAAPTAPAPATPAAATARAAPKTATYGAAGAAGHATLALSPASAPGSRSAIAAPAPRPPAAAAPMRPATPAVASAPVSAKTPVESRYPVAGAVDVSSKIFRTEHGRLGPVLAGPDGRTLYISKRDPQGVSRCTDGCTRLWRPFLLGGSDRPAPPFGSVTRTDGTRQWSHAGRPLYLWLGDTVAGDVTGDGIDGTWYAVRVATAKGSAGLATGSDRRPTP